MIDFKKMNYSTVVALLLSLFVGTTLAAYDRYEFPEAGFSMGFPFDPGAATVIKDTKTQEVRKFIVKSKSGKNEHRVEVEYYSEKNVNREVDNFFLAMISRAKEKQNVTYGGKKMLLAKGGNKKKKALLCVYYEGNKVYRLSIKSPIAFVSDEEAKTFFDSFKTTGSTAAVATTATSTQTTTASDQPQKTTPTKKESSSQAAPKVDEQYRTYIYSKMWQANDVIKLANSFNSYTFPADEMIAKMDSLNYGEVSQQLQQKGDVSFSGTRDSEVFIQLKEFDKTFTTTFDTKLLPLIEGIIQYAYKEFNDTQYGKFAKQRAVDAIDSITPLCDYLAREFPHDKSVQSTYTYFQTAFKEIAAKHYAKIYTSDFHRQNAGRIVFSRKPIDVHNIDPTQFTDTFTVNDHIYGVLFLKKGLRDLAGQDAFNFYYYVYADGQKNYIDDRIEYRIETHDNRTYVLIDALPDPNVAMFPSWTNKIASMAPRNHRFEIDCGQWGKGKLEIDLTGMDRAKLQAQAKLAESKAEENRAKAQKLPAHFAKKTATFKSPMLSQANMRAIIKREWGKHVAQVLKIVIISDGVNNWKVSLDELNRPEMKHNSCNIYFAYKGTDGKCYYMKESLTFVRDYEGNGKYSSTVRIWSHFDLYTHIPIACENIQ